MIIQCINSNLIRIQLYPINIIRSISIYPRYSWQRNPSKPVTIYPASAKLANGNRKRFPSLTPLLPSLCTLEQLPAYQQSSGDCV